MSIDPSAAENPPRDTRDINIYLVVQMLFQNCTAILWPRPFCVARVLYAFNPFNASRVALYLYIYIVWPADWSTICCTFRWHWLLDIFAGRRRVDRYTTRVWRLNGSQVYIDKAILWSAEQLKKIILKCTMCIICDEEGDYIKSLLDSF